MKTLLLIASIALSISASASTYLVVKMRDNVTAANKAALLAPYTNRPLFDVSATEALALRKTLESQASTTLSDLTSYVCLKLDEQANASSLLLTLQHSPLVEDAYIEPRYELAIWEEPHAEAETERLLPQYIPDYSTQQYYLDAPPVGVGARQAWFLPGGMGEGVPVVDIENNWDMRHLDLAPLRVIAGFPWLPIDRNHGTAVMGVLLGRANGFGVQGIVPKAPGSVAQVGLLDGIFWPRIAPTILKAARKIGKGGVLMIELHTPGPNATGIGQQGFIPMEYFRANFDAVQYAVAMGVTVVEAAGNGGENLDAAVYQGRFDRAVRDSGAILVGAGSPKNAAVPRSRLAFSNYGSRIDAQGWGYDVVTTGYGDLLNAKHAKYTKAFSGTSSATPIVAGAVASALGIVRATGGNPSPFVVREVLSSAGSPQQRGSNTLTGSVGSLPDILHTVALLKGRNKRPIISFPSTNMVVQAQQEITFLGSPPSEALQWSVRRHDAKEGSVPILQGQGGMFTAKFDQPGTYVVAVSIAESEQRFLPFEREITVDLTPAAFALQPPREQDTAFALAIEKVPSHSGALYAEFCSRQGCSGEKPLRYRLPSVNTRNCLVKKAIKPRRFVRVAWENELGRAVSNEQRLWD